MSFHCSDLECPSDLIQAIRSRPQAGIDSERNREDGGELRGTENKSSSPMLDTDTNVPSLRSRDDICCRYERNSRNDVELGGMEGETQAA